MEAHVEQQASAVQRATLPVYNLGCGGGGALGLERTLRRMPGVLYAYVNPATEMAYVAYDGAEVDVSSLVGAIERAGYGTPAIRSASKVRRTPLSPPQTLQQLDSRRLALAGGLWLAGIYTICIMAHLLFPEIFTVQTIWGYLFVGFDWTNPWTLLLGLVEAFLYGALGTWFLAVTYNALPKRTVA